VCERIASLPGLIAARHTPEQREPRDHGHFDLLAARYKYLRTFTPAVIAALPLAGNRSSAEVAALPNAVDVLRELNTFGRIVVPDSATTPAATSRSVAQVARVGRWLAMPPRGRPLFERAASGRHCPESMVSWSSAGNQDGERRSA
jgi:hypothetical protein